MTAKWIATLGLERVNRLDLGKAMARCEVCGKLKAVFARDRRYAGGVGRTCWDCLSSKQFVVGSKPAFGTRRRCRDQAMVQNEQFVSSKPTFGGSKGRKTGVPRKSAICK